MTSAVVMPTTADMPNAAESWDGSIATSATRLDILDDIYSTHASMCDAIARAQHEVVLSTYIFRTDRLSRKLTDALSDAQSRGVRVRILLDGFGNGLIWGLRRFLSGFRLRRLGFEVRYFNNGWLEALLPNRWRSMSTRYHRKICVIDRNVAFLGSQNIGWVRNIETHFRMEGDVADVLADVFEGDWNGTDAPVTSYESTHNGIPLRITLSDPARPTRSFRKNLCERIANARRSLRILTPYFLPDKGVRDALLAACDRGVNIDLLLPETSNYLLLDWASRHQLGPLLAAGCNVHLRSNAFDHSKVMLVDNKTVVFGTSNWDARSLRGNHEIDAACRQKDFAERIAALLDSKRRQSSALTYADWKKTPPDVKLRNRFASVFMPML